MTAFSQSVGGNPAVEGGERSDMRQFDSNLDQIAFTHQRPPEHRLEFDSTYSAFHADGQTQTLDNFNDQPSDERLSNDTNGSQDWLDVRDIIEMFHSLFPGDDRNDIEEEGQSDVRDEGDNKPTQGWYPF
jgi:hypothetical protein